VACAACNLYWRELDRERYGCYGTDFDRRLDSARFVSSEQVKEAMVKWDGEIRELAIEQVENDSYRQEPERTPTHGTLPLLHDIREKPNREYRPELEAGLRPFVDSLAETQREALMMRYGTQMTLTAIGDALHITRQSVDSRLKRARETLRRALLAGAIYREEKS
jgi:RNA polymerase sigma factor (sigma-70 family)